MGIEACTLERKARRVAIDADERHRGLQRKAQRHSPASAAVGGLQFEIEARPERHAAVALERHIDADSIRIEAKRPAVFEVHVRERRDVKRLRETEHEGVAIETARVQNVGKRSFQGVLWISATIVARLPTWSWQKKKITGLKKRPHERGCRSERIGPPGDA